MRIINILLLVYYFHFQAGYECIHVTIPTHKLSREHLFYKKEIFSEVKFWLIAHALDDVTFFVTISRFR